MDIVIDRSSVGPSRVFRDAVRRFSRLLLGRFARHVAKIELIPRSDSRGHQRKWRCDLRIQLVPNGEVLIKETDGDLTAAMVSAFARARRTIARVVRFRRNRALHLAVQRHAPLQRLVVAA